MEEFPYEIKLEDSWFDWEYQKFQELLSLYLTARRILDDIIHDATKPIPCKSWVVCYWFGDQPSNLATLWKEISDYIEEQSLKDGWSYSHITTEQVDVNNDPYDDCENLTDKYTVYAVVENKEDFKESVQYKQQKEYVQKLYNEVLIYKQRLDDKLKSNK